MDRLIFTVTFLLITITLAGCYTQVGYYEPRSSTRQTSYRHQDDRPHRDGDEKMESEQEEQTEVEAESSEVEDEGYYGRRKPSYGYSSRYSLPYDYDYYPTYPYYGGYHPLYPYYGYSYYPYYSSYGNYHYYGHYGYRYRRYSYPKRHSKIGDLNFGKRRSQSYRGVRSRRPSSRRPDKSLRKSEESRAPARSSSGSRRDRSRRSGRR